MTDAGPPNLKTVQQLAQLFSCTTKHVHEKLAECPASGTKGRGKLYDVADAARYLVKPDAATLEDFVRKMKPSDIPASISESFWSARLKEQKWRENAKELWRTGDVMSSFSDVFMTMKQQLELLPGIISKNTKGINSRQMIEIEKCCDQIIFSIQDAVREKSTQFQTEPQEGEAITDMSELSEENEDPEDDIDDEDLL